MPIPNNYQQLEKDIQSKNPWLIDKIFMLRYLDDDKSWIDVTDKNDIEVMVAHCEKKIS